MKEIRMKMTKSQYFTDIAGPITNYCLVTGTNFGDWDENPYLVLHEHVVGNLISVTDSMHTFEEYNPELFLAIAAMSAAKNGIRGEYWKFIRDTTSIFTPNKIYKASNSVDNIGAFISDNGEPNGFVGSNHDYFVKATLEEIIEHFKVNTFKAKEITPELMAEKLRRIKELL